MKRSAVASTLWLAGGAVGRGATQFVSLLLLARLLSPESFGKYAVAQGAVYLLGSLLSLRLQHILLRTPEQHLTTSRRDLILSAVVLQTSLVLPVLAGALYLLDLEWSWAMLIVATFAVEQIVVTQLTLHERSLRYPRVVAVETGLFALTYGAAIAGALVGLGPIVLYARGLLQGALALGTIAALGWFIPFRLRVLALDDWRAIVAESRGLWIDGAFEEGFDRAPVVLVGLFAGPIAAGAFFQARRVAGFAHTFTQSTVTRMMLNYPHRAAAGADRRSFLASVVLVEGLALAVPAVLLFTFADRIVPLFLGEGWDAAVPLIQALSIAVVAQPIFGTLSATAISLRQMRAFVLRGRIGQLVGLIAATLIASIFVPAPVAVAWGLSFAFVVGGILFALKLLDAEPSAVASADGAGSGG